MQDTTYPVPNAADFASKEQAAPKQAQSGKSASKRPAATGHTSSDVVRSKEVDTNGRAGEGGQEGPPTETSLERNMRRAMALADEHRNVTKSGGDGKKQRKAKDCQKGARKDKGCHKGGRKDKGCHKGKAAGKP
jgi:hypothetical protein